MSLVHRGIKELPLCQGRTNVDGRIALGPVPPRGIIARVSHPGHAVTTGAVDLDADETVIRLSASGVLEGRLVADVTLADRYVIALSMRNDILDVDEFPHLTTTDARGDFRITGVAPGEYQLEVFHHAFDGNPLKVPFDRLEELDDTLARADAVVRAGEVTRLDIPFFAPGMPSACTVTGQVLIDGVPAESTLVTIRHAQYASAGTDATGRFRFTDVAPGEAEIRVYTRDSRGSLKRKITLTSAETRDLTIEIESHQATLHVSRDDGGATHGVHIYVEDLSGGGRSQARVGEDGEAIVRCPAAGRYRATVWDFDIGTGSVEFDVPSDGPIPLTVITGVPCAGTFTMSDDMALDPERHVYFLVGQVQEGEEVLYRQYVLDAGTDRFSLRGLTAGRWECRVMQNRGLSAPAHFDLPPAGNEEITLHFEPDEG